MWLFPPKRRTSSLLLLLCLAFLAKAVQGFMCYTGDSDVLRRKACPNFSDICFKKIPGPHDRKGELQRGCFNSEIATMITGSGEVGCHNIPDSIGNGRICLCDTELCNSSHPTIGFSSPTSKLLLGLCVSLIFWLF